jgi:hypothetical protein
VWFKFHLEYVCDFRIPFFADDQCLVEDIESQNATDESGSGSSKFKYDVIVYGLGEGSPGFVFTS